jgi:PPOX class probable F420-dependent enzyme
VISEQPPIVDELLRSANPCCLTTLRRDGTPYSVVVWCNREAERITVNAADGVWLRHLRRDPRLSLVVVDTANILRHVAVQGRAGAISPDPEYAHIDSLSEIYEGRPYAYSTPEDVPRFRVEIEPERIRSLDLAPPP